MNSVEVLVCSSCSLVGAQDLLRNQGVSARRNIQFGRPNSVGRWVGGDESHGKSHEACLFSQNDCRIANADNAGSEQS
jgi:hypothetical protein